MHVAVFKYDKSFASLYSKPLFLFPSLLVLQDFGVWFDIYMKRGNQSDGGHEKITWKRIRDLLTRRRDNVTLRRGGDVVIGCFIWVLQATSWIRTTETSWWRTSETSLGVSFDTCLRHREHVLMRRCCYVLLTRLTTSLGRTERRRYDVSMTSCCRVGISSVYKVKNRKCGEWKCGVNMKTGR